MTALRSLLHSTALNRSKHRLTLAGLEVERSVVKRATNVVARRLDHLGDAIHMQSNPPVSRP
jgi:hypothetical protein